MRALTNQIADIFSPNDKTIYRTAQKYERSRIILDIPMMI